MAAEPIRNLNRLCLHTITTRPWPLVDAIQHYAAAGVAGISVWREAMQGCDPVEAGRRTREAGMAVVSLVRGGFYPAREKKDRRKAIEENLRIIDEAAALGAPHVVLVCGAVPGQLLEESQKQIQEGIEATLSHAEQTGVKLAIEPLHPMYADSRSAINTLAQANDLAESIGSPQVGVAVDVYHLWWDPQLEEQIERSGRLNRILAFHICDWKTPTDDLLFDRGLMGEGCIPIRRIRGWVEAAGFSGFNEVEIFSNTRWTQNQEQWLQEIIRAYREAS
jgi:sugar phosphate isomerase/epimerase